MRPIRLGPFWFVLAFLFSVSAFGEETLTQGRNLLDRVVLYPSQKSVKIQPPSTARQMLPSGLEVWVNHRTPLDGSTNAESQRLAVIHFIGNASRAERESVGPGILELFPKEFDVTEWRVNYSGYGGSSGEATMRSFSRTALEIFDFVHAKDPNVPVIVSGNSIGTLAALYLATQRAPRGVILRNPVPLREVILGKFGWWNIWIGASIAAGQIPSELNSIENARKVAAPTLIFSSEKDTMIPRDYQMKVVGALKGQKLTLFLTGADHNDPIPVGMENAIRDDLEWLLSANHD